MCKVLPFHFEVILYPYAIVAESMTAEAISFGLVPNISWHWDNADLGV